MLARKVRFALPFAGLIACGGRVDLGTVQGPGPAPSSTVGGDASTSTLATTLSGSFKGKSVQVNDAIALLQSANGQTELIIAYTDGTSLCSRLQANQQQADTHYVSIIFIATATSPGGAAPAITPGTYTVTTTPQNQGDGSTLFSSGGYSSLDASCQNNEVMNVAQVGTITLAAVGQQVSGTFQFSFSNGDAFQGTFDVPLCQAPLTGNPRPACVP
jgi:hypothetical protein